MVAFFWGRFRQNPSPGPKRYAYPAIPFPPDSLIRRVDIRKTAFFQGHINVKTPYG